MSWDGIWSRLVGLRWVELGSVFLEHLPACRNVFLLHTSAIYSIGRGIAMPPGNAKNALRY